jgi:hypothetical protein
MIRVKYIKTYKYQIDHGRTQVVIELLGNPSGPSWGPQVSSSISQLECGS